MGIAYETSVYSFWGGGVAPESDAPVFGSHDKIAPWGSS